MPVIVNYEVYVFDKGEWSIYSRYTSAQRNNAINEAKSLEQQIDKPTKVIRESFDTSSSESEEIVVYLSEKLSKVRKKMVQNRREGKSNDDLAEWARELQLEGDKPSRGNRGKNISLGSFILKIIITFTLCTMFAAAISFAFGIIIRASSLRLDSTTMSALIFGSFVLVFVGSSIVASILFIPWDKFATAPQRRARLNRKGSAGKSASILGFKDSFRDFVKFLFNSNYNEVGLAPEEVPNNMSLNDIQEFMEGADETAKQQKEEDGLIPEPEPKTAKDEKAKEKPNKEEKLPSLETKIKDDDDKFWAKKENKYPAVRLSHDEQIEQIKDTVTSFVEGIVDAAKSYNIRIDIFTRIAVNLIVAGACERICTFFALNAQDNKEILKHAIAKAAYITFVSGSEQNKSFYAAFNAPEFEGYHQRLIVIGNKSIEQILRKTGRDVYDDIGEEILRWRAEVEPKINLHRQEQQKTETVILMFTDIVDSTTLTEQKGEDFAKNILHIHNTVARDSLRMYHGREIKNLGDGLFASFPNAEDSLKAAINIQEGISLYNYNHPEAPFFIRIGMNAGKPMIEDGDFFGSSVNIASRICAAAGSGEIFISQGLYDMVSAKGFFIEDEGLITLKGVAEKQRLYSVNWHLAPRKEALSDEEKEQNEQNELSGGASVKEEMLTLEKDWKQEGLAKRGS